MSDASRPRTDGPLDLGELRERLSGLSVAAGLGEIERVEPISVDGSSLTYTATFSDPERPACVVKAGPPGLEPVRNRDLLRQARGMRAAGRIPGMRVPAILFEDGGAPVEVPQLFAMSLEPGECMEPIFSAGELPSADEVRGRALSAARVLGTLHSADPRELGLTESPVGLWDEVERWRKAFGTIAEDVRGRAVEAGELLLESIPEELPPAFIHGDYRLGNTLCSGGEVSAVIDWEIWSVSDPRIDLAWLLRHRDPAINPNGSRVAPGMPDRDEMVAEYEEAAGRPGAVADLNWFEALAGFKQAAIGALIWKRAPAPGGADEVAERTRKVQQQVNDAIALLQS